MEGRTNFGLVGTYAPLSIKPIVFSDDDADDTDKAFTDTPKGYIPFARAFIPRQSGTIRLIFPDGSQFDKPVIAETKYVVVVRRFNATGTSGVTSGEMQN